MYKSPVATNVFVSPLFQYPKLCLQCGDVILSEPWPAGEEDMRMTRMLYSAPCDDDGCAALHEDCVMKRPELISHLKRVTSSSSSSSSFSSSRPSLSQSVGALPLNQSLNAVRMTTKIPFPGYKQCLRSQLELRIIVDYYEGVTPRTLFDTGFRFKHLLAEYQQHGIAPLLKAGFTHNNLLECLARYESEHLDYNTGELKTPLPFSADEWRQFSGDQPKLT